MSLDASAFLLDFLEIGKSKYIHLRSVLLAESINLPEYNRVALHRSQISLADDIHLVERYYPIGIGISLKELLTQIINRIVLNISIHDSEQPLKILHYTLPGHNYLYRPKFPVIFIRTYLLIIESTH